MNAQGMRPGIILLREGTDTSQGTPQLISNINACQAVADTVRTTLGPSGRDKLIATGRHVTISNDGATIMKLLEIEHPAAKTLVDISMSQDAEVGDGTTSVVLLAAEILAKMKPFVEEGVHPQILQRNIRNAGKMAVEKVQELAVPFQGDELEDMLLKTARTALNSKLIANHKDLFAPMVVEAVQALHQGGSLDDLSSLVAIKQISGGDVRQSFLVNGVAFKKTFSYAGFEQMTKQFTNPGILLLNVELELKSEKENAEVRITDPSQYQSIVDAEWKVIYDKLDACVDSGAQIVLSKLPIGDLATQYFADRGLFCAGRVTDGDLKRVAKATGGSVQTSTHGITKDMLGTCGVFEERQVGDERFNVFTDCPQKLTSTIVLRGGTEQFIAESERSVHDALMVVKRSLQSGSVVAGGGAVEMEVSRCLREHALTIEGKGQLIITAYAKALEVIPRQLCENAGYDSTDILAALRRKHAVDADGKWYGVDVINGHICDTFDLGVWEPSDNKVNSFDAATEAACVILSIDETVMAPKSQDPNAHHTGQMDQGNKPMSNMMGGAMQAAQGGARSGQLGPGVSYMKGRGGG
jgi:T-complex protein 1 subunit eta